MSHTPSHQPTPDWDLSGINDSRLQLTTDTWETMSTSGHDYLTRNPTDTDRHDTYPYSNHMDKLGNKLQTLVSDLRAEKNSRTNMEKRLLDTECRIHGMLAQLNRMDQDTITNNQFLAQRLTEMEQTYNNHVAKEVNNLADLTADVLRKSEEDENEYMTWLTEDMDKMEGSIQSQASELEGMKVTLEEERTNEKTMLRNKFEDLQPQVEDLNTRFKR